MNINIELFKKTGPVKKLDIIKNLTESELLAITADTTTRIVKEVGNRRGTTRNKELWIDRDRQQGNNWNSIVESVSLYKGRLYVDCYVQFASTDTTQPTPYETFFSRNDFNGSIQHSDRYGNPQTYYYRYDSHDKAKVLRSICLEYVRRKYADKLKQG